jgi:ABC-2 type transport system ATP-binding protein
MSSATDGIPPAARGEPVIETRGLRMRYGATDVLHGLDLRVERGEVVALLGPNGAGKTTTIEILEGFRRRSGGEARVLGTDPDRGGEAWRARLGIVLQSWRDHGRWRVRELLGHLGSYYAPYGTPARPRPYDVDELLALVGLTGQASRVLARLSGGQRRRLDVAVGLVGRPDLLFLDEPTTGFDPRARRDFHELLRQMARVRDTAILLATHDLDEAERVAGRVLILVDGRIVADGTPEQLARRIAGKTMVRYTVNGGLHVDSVEDATRHVRGLFERHGEALGDLEVRRTSLEEVYLSMVRDAEAGEPAEAAKVIAGGSGGSSPQKGRAA